MPETVEFEIPSAEHSVAGMIDTFHRIAEGHAPLTPGLGKVIEPPPDIDILWKDIHLKKEQIYLKEILIKSKNNKISKKSIPKGLKLWYNSYKNKHGIKKDKLCK